MSREIFILCFMFIVVLLAYCFPFFLGGFHLFVFEYLTTAKVMSYCVSWPDSVMAMYFFILLFSIATPFLLVNIYYKKAVKVKSKVGAGTLLSCFGFCFFSWMLLLFGIPFETLDGAARLVAYIYCNFYIGTFFVLLCFGMNTVVSTTCLFLAIRIFFSTLINGKWNHEMFIVHGILGAGLAFCGCAFWECITGNSKWR